MRLIAAVVLILSSMCCASAGDADWHFIPDNNSFSIELNETSNLYRNTGTIVLRDPSYGFVLGRYQFASGGFGRGSAPFGVYEVGEFISDNPADDPLRIGPRWNIHHIGMADGEAYDPRLNDTRTELELHSLRYVTGTLGCIGVLGGPEVWSDFMKNLNAILSQAGRIVFVLTGSSIQHDSIPFVSVTNSTTRSRHHAGRKRRR